MLKIWNLVQSVRRYDSYLNSYAWKHLWWLHKEYSEAGYRINPNNSNTQKICCNHPKIWTMWLYHRVLHPKDADGIANSVDPDQTAPLGAVWSGSALFAQTYLSKNLGSLWYTERVPFEKLHFDAMLAITYLDLSMQDHNGNETKTTYWPITQWLYCILRHGYLCRGKTCFMTYANIVEKAITVVEELRFSPGFP